MVKRPSKRAIVAVAEIELGLAALHATDQPCVRCTRLPEFIRAKKHLGSPFCVFVDDNWVPDGARVVIAAGNAKNPCAELRNNVSRVCNGVARFDDLRFLGKSGRGTRFNVYLRFEYAGDDAAVVVDAASSGGVKPLNVIVKEAVYANAIKVTVDGPRPPRNCKIYIFLPLATFF